MRKCNLGQSNNRSLGSLKTRSPRVVKHILSHESGIAVVNSDSSLKSIFMFPKEDRLICYASNS